MEAYRERKWGPFPALRQVLEDKRLSGKHFGITSASDNLFDRLHRLIEITLLTRDYSEELLKTANNDFGEALQEDLTHLESDLKQARSFIDGEIENIKALRHSL